MIFLDLIDLRKLRRVAIHLVGIMLALWLQTMVLSKLEIFGAKPFFIPAVAIVIGLWEGGIWGALLGLFAGAYCDMCFSDSSVLFLILFAAFGFFSGVLAEYFLNRRFISYLVLAALALLITALCQIVPLWIFRSTPLQPLLTTALLQTLWSLPFAAPLFYITKRIADRPFQL